MLLLLALAACDRTAADQAFAKKAFAEAYATLSKLANDCPEDAWVFSDMLLAAHKAGNDAACLERAVREEPRELDEAAEKAIAFNLGLCLKNRAAVRATRVHCNIRRSPRCGVVREAHRAVIQADDGFVRPSCCVRLVPNKGVEIIGKGFAKVVGAKIHLVDEPKMESWFQTTPPWEHEETRCYFDEPRVLRVKGNLVRLTNGGPYCSGGTGQWAWDVIYALDGTTLRLVEDRSVGLH